VLPRGPHIAGDACKNTL